MSILAYLLNIVLLAGLIWWLSKQKWAKELQPYFYPALLLKLVCGILLGLLYFYYYGAGDTINYYQASVKLTAYAKQDFSGYIKLLLFNEFEREELRAALPFTQFAYFSNSFFMIKVVSVLNLITFKSYYLNTLYFSLFSFWGSAKVAAVLRKIYPNSYFGAITAFLFFPSVVFWGSGLLKDSVLMGSMCWVVAFVLSLAHRQKLQWTKWVLMPVILYIFIRIKIFFSAALLLVLLAYLIIKLLSNYSIYLQKPKQQILAMLGIMVVSGVAATQVFSIYNVDFILRWVVINYEQLLKLSLDKPHIEFGQLEPTLLSLIQHAPEAIFSAIYRPFLGESWKVLYLLLALENFAILILTLIALLSLFRINKHRLPLFQVALVLYIIIAATMVGLTTPNFGTLSRYRIIFLPFLVYLLLQNYYIRSLFGNQSTRPRKLGF